MSYSTAPSTSSPPSSFRARLAGIPATTRARPLTFPLGALVGFLLGFSAASLWGYSTLLSSHRALAERTSASLSQLEETRKSVEEELVQRVGRMGVSSDQLEALNRRVGGRIEGLKEELGREVVHRERIERRVVGLEEENLELRRRLWRMGE
ncbi:hypothetical protein BCV69DRAFT_2681 [Microstroma glucosiphilum]|uniref:Uncharacterized protein n=1 Tax=Pseudomicrostroma glucosiphilum TaxID=1684307 RepID=A0A316UGU6_9BASI|nr:hypothetical protein BCV69DRAFT_2681 [Pseudomicrostroma glucosiphilum]PWN23551.1 hypothetical protein BCV69DRAFT_2681 [Pseudomicrostroma glucosiphilum]